MLVQQMHMRKRYGDIAGVATSVLHVLPFNLSHTLKLPLVRTSLCNTTSWATPINQSVTEAGKAVLLCVASILTLLKASPGLGHQTENAASQPQQSTPNPLP